MKPANFPNRKETRVAEAQARQVEHDALTVDQKVAKLDERLGKGVGAKGERARLAGAKP